MWISKKKYNELIAERDNYNKIASETIQLNGRVIDSNARILEEMKGVQELNHQLQQRNEELLDEYERLEGIARRAVSEKDEMIDECLEMKAKLDLAIKQRDHYYDLLESTSDAYEEGKAISREAE
jgi:hypothetical protein